jgi:hypothetical protein
MLPLISFYQYGLFSLGDYQFVNWNFILTDPSINFVLQPIVKKYCGELIYINFIIFIL